MMIKIILRRIVQILVLLFLGNYPFLLLGNFLPQQYGFLFLWFGIFCFLVMQIIPVRKKQVSIRIKVLAGSYELLLISSVTILLELVFLIWLALTKTIKEYHVPAWIFCLVMSAAVIVISMANGILRVVLSSKQTKLLWKILLIFTMWIPLWNLILVRKICHIVKKELILEANIQYEDQLRKELEICKTKFPIVMVHGVFFRDWQMMNYWGRIPYELIRNGASVFYGRQESALPVAKSAEEVKTQIQEVLKKTGAEKVNIIAHSKGGLDTRYAISRLGMAPYVASLTTINTPHRGCIWADVVLNKLPGIFLHRVAEKYNKVFQVLGDKSPDFYRAVMDLTASRCEELNRIMPDMDGVYYQSVTSVMKKRSSAGFPLNLVYPIVKKEDGDNDGLVAVPSAVWGRFLGVLSCEKKRGISHADMIDLMHENIDGFQVREYYVQLVKELKAKGF